MSQIKLAIGLPAYTGQITAFAFRMWLDLGAMLRASEARFKLVQTNLIETCGIDVARNRLVAEALEVGADWLLMIDADTWHEDGSDILQMISDADRMAQHTKVGAVAAQVPKRDPDDTHLMVYRYLNEKRYPATLPSGGIADIDAAATAMMAINLNFIREHKLKAPWFKFEWRDGDTKPFQGEDLYFCARVREAGGVILGDGRFIAKHLQRPQVIEVTR